MIFCWASSTSTNRYSRLNTSSCPANDFLECAISPSRTVRSLGRLTVLRCSATAVRPSRSSGKTSRMVNMGPFDEKSRLHLTRRPGKRRARAGPEPNRRQRRLVHEVDQHAPEDVEKRWHQLALGQ